jgi:2'-5' RNA ligase
MSERGQSAIVVPVPAVEPAVSFWRQRFDHSAVQGMPAHITVLYPFLPERCLTHDVLAQLSVVCGQVGAFDVRFSRTGRFPGVLYLKPEPADRLRDLTVAIAGQWPNAHAYEGRFSEIVPHLTVALAEEAAVLDEVEADLRPKLPLVATVDQAYVYVFDGITWHGLTALPLDGSRQADS